MQATSFKSEFKSRYQSLFKNNRKWIHIGIWCSSLLLVLIYALFTGDMINLDINVNKDLDYLPSKTQIVRNLALAIGLAMIMVYYYLLLVIPFARWKMKRRYIWLGILIMTIIMFVIFVFAVLKVEDSIGGGIPVTQEEKNSWINFILNVVMVMSGSAIIVLLFFEIFYFIDIYDQQTFVERYKQIKMHQLEAESQLLQNQINPHFLFNSLNNIYSLSIQKSDKAPIMAQKLQELFGYMQAESKSELVPLEDEIRFIKNYINLEMIRNQEGSVQSSFEITGDIDKVAIPPLLLINFVENAFKHGIKAGINHPYIKLNIKVEHNVLIFQCSNSNTNQNNPSSINKKVGGIGLANVRKRLTLLYLNRHSLVATIQPNDYTVTLKIEL